MKKFITQITVLGMMTFAAQVRAGELSATETPSVQGRVFISVNDFQKIIRGSERILSSENESGLQVQEAQSSNATIAALQSMSQEDKAELYKKVLPLAKKEARALSSAVESLTSQLEKIKTERKALQAARLSQSQDGKLQEKLFSNLLEESNLESKIAEAKREIEESHVLVLEYSKMGSTTELVNVKHGQRNLWDKLSSANSELTAVAIVQN